MKLKNKERKKTVLRPIDQVEENFQYQLSIEKVDNEALVSDLGPFVKWCDRYFLKNYHIKAPENAEAPPSDTFYAW